MEIKLITDNNGKERMQYINCSSDFPNSSGFYVSASACGAGKTSIILDICQKKWKGGILVVVGTKKNADELENALMGQQGHNTAGRKTLALHADKIKEMNQYRGNPACLSSYDVLIITSARLMIDPIKLFMMHGNNPCREYVLIDEMISFFPTPFEIPKGLKDTVSFVDTKKRHQNCLRIGETTINGKHMYQHLYCDRERMEAAYKMGSYRCFKSKDSLTDYKMGTIFYHVCSCGFTPIQQKVIQYSDKSIIILFDGTADLLFRPNDNRVLKLTGDRYNSDISFIQYPLTLRRKNKEGWEMNDLQTYAKDFLDLVVRLSKTEKVLVVTWKTVDIFKTNTFDADRFETCEKLYFPDMLLKYLSKHGANINNVSVIYRGSGLDRGSNEYRNYSSVVFLGEWRIPDNIISDINSYFNLKADFETYKVSLIIQTICRLRIRMHTGQSISVYFSDDMDYNLMWRVQEYFKANSPNNKKIGGVYKPCQGISKPSKGFLLDLTMLFSYDNNIRTSFLNRAAYTFTIPLQQLYHLIPRDRCKIDRYNSLVRFLKGYGITMNINN